MKFHQILSEVSTPTGSIFIRFKEKVGEVSANPQRGERSEATYLTAYAGFANAPEDLQQGNALRNFNSINSAEDIVSMIKSIFTDKVFLSVKSLTIYDDFTKPLQGDRSPIYKRHPFLLKFMKWVEREGGNQIKIADKVGQEGPPRIKRPRKENPNFGRKIRDVEQGETKKTVTFTVSPRFYKQAQRDLPNLMKYRGPNGTFVMPNELFMQFRAQAEKTYPYAEIKLVNRVATGEGLNEGGDHDPHSRGVADGYYGRRADPHKYVSDEEGKNQRVKLTDPDEIDDYMTGYKDDSFGRKEYESVSEGYTINGKKVMAKAGPQPAKAPATTIADKKMATNFESRIIDMEDDDHWLMEGGKASKAYCRAKSKNRSNMGASQLSSCISQGYISHKTKGKSVKVADRRIKLDGVKMKGEKYGGPKSTKAGE